MNPKLGVRAFFGIALALFMTMPAINLSEPLMRERALKMIKEWDGSGLVKLAFQGDKLESWLSAYLWQTGISINPDQVLIGYDGWLHLGDENSRTISVTRGAATKWREKRSREIARSLLSWDRWLQEQGVQSMTFMLSPDKATVYPETLPHWVRTSTGDTIASIKAASEFGITKTMKLAGLLMFVTDIHSLGLKDTQGMYLTDSWYWDKDDASREFAKKFFSKAKSMPTSIHAANYSAATTYLKAVTAAKTTDSDKVMAQLKSMEISDFFGKGRIRPDGRYVHDMYLLEVKKPAESKQPWDYMKVAATLKGDDVFTTKAESKCALWK
mgnify:CR=1 FL=1